MATYELTYPSESASEDRMLDEVQALLAGHDVAGRCRQRFLLAVSEAFTNALVHGNRLEAGKSVKLRLDINPHRLSADIVDEGSEGLQRVRERRPASVLSESGRGVNLMEHVTSGLRFATTEKGGLRVSLSIDIVKEKEVSKYPS